MKTHFEISLRDAVEAYKILDDQFRQDADKIKYEYSNAFTIEDEELAEEVERVLVDFNIEFTNKTMHEEEEYE